MEHTVVYAASSTIGKCHKCYFTGGGIFRVRLFIPSLSLSFLRFITIHAFFVTHDPLSKPFSSLLSVFNPFTGAMYSPLCTPFVNCTLVNMLHSLHLTDGERRVNVLQVPAINVNTNALSETFFSLHDSTFHVALSISPSLWWEERRGRERGPLYTLQPLEGWAGKETSLNTTLPIHWSLWT